MAAEEEAALHLLCGLNVEVIALHDVDARRNASPNIDAQVDAQNKRETCELCQLDFEKQKKSSDIDSPTNGGRLRVLPPSGATRAAGCL